MSRAAISSLTWAIYMTVLGLFMALAPDAFCALLQFAPPTDFWIRMVGVLVAIVGYLYARAAQGEVKQYFRWSAEARPVVLLASVVFVALRMTQPALLLFGVVDAIGAAWMFWALRRDSAG